MIRAIQLLPVLALTAAGAELKPETVCDWDEHVRTVNAQMQERLRPERPFLWSDEQAERNREVRAGKILVGPGDVHTPFRVSSGLVHHWMGATFVPGARIDDVLSVLRSYERYKEIFHPNVIDSRPLSQSPTQDRYFVILANKAVVSQTALESDIQTSYFQVDARRWYSVSTATRVQEIQNLGQTSERRLPVDQGSGYIWRLYNISRFEERDGGVYVEVEAMALSRDIPVALRLIVDPIVRRVSRTSVSTSLRQTQEAVIAKLDTTPSPAPAAARVTNLFRAPR